jgi:site-specific recombinase XerD
VNYVRIVRRFIERCYGSASPDWLTLRPQHIRDFLTEQMSLLAKSPSRSAPVTAMRAFLKMLVSLGLMNPSLLAALPVVRVWRLASIPRYLSPDEVARVLSSVDEGSLAGLRDKALLLTLARLGMRAGEVASLDLDDIDWQEGRILVRAGKTRRERCLPLSQELGTAFVRYLREARPKTSNRALFLSISAPRRRITSHAITAMATRYLTRADVTPSRLGAHSLRHSIATQLVRRGASFKEVADILGHQQLRSTQVYAKLDLASLARIAMPWPRGGVR